jgi:hypothetical protein
MGLTLQLDNWEGVVNAIGCQQILDQAAKATTAAAVFCLDDRPLPKRKYRKPFFAFWLKGKRFVVGAKRLPHLRAECEKVIAGGEGRFGVGIKIISATATLTDQSRRLLDALRSEAEKCKDESNCQF